MKSGSGGNINFDEYSFFLYKEKKSNTLYEFYTTNKLNVTNGVSWPPANGGFDVVHNYGLKIGDRFDRYGNALPNWDGTGKPPFGGTFTSPIINNSSFSFSQRSLTGNLENFDFYYEIEVLKELPFKGEKSTVIPWFGKEGGAVQVDWQIPKNGDYPKIWNDLVEEGYIRVIIKASPSNAFSGSALINSTL